MPFDHLSEFLQKLTSAGQLLRVRTEVDPRYQIAALTAEARQSDSRGGPALLFENVKGARQSVVTNLLGTEERVLLALGDESLAAARQRLVDWLTPRMGDTTPESIGLAARLAKLVPRMQKTAFAQQVARLGRDINLDEFAFPRHFDGETGRTLTAAQVWLVAPDGQRRWVSAPILEIAGPQSLLVHWTLFDQGPDIVEEYRHDGKPTPVIVSIGGDPLLQLAAQLPDLPGTDAAQLAAVLRGQPLNLVRGRSVELDGPADAEFLIEGYIDAKEIDAAQGTVTSPSGLLVARQRLAVIRVTAVTHRSQPVLPSVVHAASDSEENAWYPLLSELLTPVLQRMHPAVQTFRFSRDGQGRRIGFVGLRTRFPGHARQVLQGLANWPTLADAVVLIAVDEDLDLSRSSTIWQQVAAHADPGRDVWTPPVVRDASHRACRDLGNSATLLIDATRKPDAATGDWIRTAELPEAARESAKVLWQQISRQ
jgi:4-hydroxy-3-polyprenylbenzoate decarboxylase